MIIAPTLPLFTTPTKHPAKYTEALLPFFAKWLPRGAKILDPMAGTGKLARIKLYGFSGTIVCNDIADWGGNRYVDEWYHSDAAEMEWSDDGAFDAIVTSPTYGNRMADTYRPSDDRYERHTYRAGLGQDLDRENTGAMQWGETYRVKHRAIYSECVRVLKSRGLFLCNVSDHIRAGRRVYVSKFHLDTLRGLGLELLQTHSVKTPRQRKGAHRDMRTACEFIFVLRKQGKSQGVNE